MSNTKKDKARNFHHPTGTRRYRKRFVLSTEGRKTEPKYFSIFNVWDSQVHVKCLKGQDNSAPLQALERIKKKLKEDPLKNSDEAWIVVDKDQWTDAQLSQLQKWVQEPGKHGLALSNPNFEFWLLLHFEEGRGVGSARDCSRKLKQHLAEYDKDIDEKKVSKEMVEQAVTRAKNRDTPPCSDWPRNTGTTVYRLVERILRSSDDQEKL